MVNWARSTTSGGDAADPAPQPVGGLAGAIAIAAGWNHSLALKSDGTVWAWGLNSFGQLGPGAGSGIARYPT